MLKLKLCRECQQPFRPAFRLDYGICFPCRKRKAPKIHRNRLKRNLNVINSILRKEI